MRGGEGFYNTTPGLPPAPSGEDRALTARGGGGWCDLRATPESRQLATAAGALGWQARSRLPLAGLGSTTPPGAWGKVSVHQPHRDRGDASLPRLPSRVSTVKMRGTQAAVSHGENNEIDLPTLPLGVLMAAKLENKDMWPSRLF